MPSMAGEQPFGTIRVRCPHCRRDTHASWSLPTNKYEFSYYQHQPSWARQRFGDIYTSGNTVTLQCDITTCPENGCKGPITITLLWRSSADALREQLGKGGWHLTPGDTNLLTLLEVLPSSDLPRPVLDSLPEKIQAEFPAVADLAAEGRAPATAAAGCGSCLEEALKALEQRALDLKWMSAPLKKDLRFVERIDALVAAGVIPRDVGEWSHQVRLLRNDGTHELKADAEQVRELVAFLKFFFEAGFALPARLAKLKIAKDSVEPPPSSAR